MKDWLRFFGLSFFSDNIAKEAKTRGVMNCVLGFVLAVAIIFCGVLAANTVPFYTHYGNASEFKECLYNVVGGLNISVGGDLSADKRVDTYLNDADAGKYKMHGYNVIVDTRPANALDDFETYCVDKNGRKISYEEYSELGDEEKSAYEFKLVYTPNELILTDELVAEYEKYLSECDNPDVKNGFAELSGKKDGVARDEYRRKVYALYVKAYYPDMSKFERVGDVPLLRSYYYRNYLNNNDIQKSLFIFSDVMFGFFDTDGGLSITLYGSYASVESGTLSPDKADGFIEEVFGSSVSASANVYLMNTCKYIPIIVAIPLVLAAVCKLVFAIKKRTDGYEMFSVCFKIECSFIAAASLFCAIILFAIGFFVSSNVLNILPLIVFGTIMAIRTAVYLLKEAKTSKPCDTI